MSAPSKKSIEDLGGGLQRVTTGRGRYYELEGVKLPSVTTILGVLDKPALIYWAVNCYHDYLAARSGDYAELLAAIEDGKREFRNVSQQAKDVGTQVHEAIEAWLKRGEFLALEGQAAIAFDAYLEWEQQHKLERIQAEVPIYSRAHRYAGCSDLICRIDDRDDLILLDYKTSKGIYDEYYMQCAAYREGYNETATDSKVTASAILRLDKETGMPEFDDCANRDHLIDFARFKSLTAYYHATKEAEALAKNTKTAKAA